MIIALLVLIVAILLLGAAAVRGFLSNAIAISFAVLALIFILGFVKLQYDKHAAGQQHSHDVENAKRLTLETVARNIGKPQSSLLDVVSYTADDDFEVCGTIAETSGYGGPNGRQRWISNGGGRFEYERADKKTEFDGRIALLCTVDHSAATMAE